MSTYTVVNDDFRNIRRSYIVLGVVVAFTAMVALAFAGSSEVHDAGVRTLWGASALVGWGFPLFVAPLTYLAIAGDRARGSIGYFLGLPNSRAEYVLAKYVTRASVAAAAVLVAVTVGFVIAVTTYPDGAELARFAIFAGVSVLYALAMAGMFLAISAVTSTRARAMFGVLGAYFLFVAFWTGPLPAFNLSTVLDALMDLTGVELSDGAIGYVGALSPTGAYLNALRPAYTGIIQDYEVFAGVYANQPDSMAYEAWFNVLVLAAWSILAPIAGYLGFRRSELG